MDAQKTKTKKSKLSILISWAFMLLIIGGLILLILSNRDKFSEYKETLLHVNLVTLFIVLLVTMSANFFRGWRWYYLVLAIKNNISLINIFRVTFSALAANFTMPGKLGVPVKAVLLKKTENIEVGKSLPSILGEIFIEHSSEILIAIVSVFIGGHISKLTATSSKIADDQGVVMNIGIAVGILLLGAVAWFAFKRKLKSMDFIHNFMEAIHLTKKRVDYVVYSYIITIVNLIISYYVFWMVVATLGHPEVDLTFVIFAGTITNFLGLISPIPGGVGVREITIYGLYDFYYGLGGIAFLAIVLMRLITYLSLFLCFLLERFYSEVIVARKKREVIVSQ
ncbi:MAG: lysylphosphatidylglycerol synthase transmembrane domain-containing protein [Candidatus Zhuqueibacterota bacterium]